jgi:hypothetical protein
MRPPPIEAEVQALGLLGSHCREKAAAARWAAECQRRRVELRDDATDGVPSDPSTLAWTTALTDAYYWASARDRTGDVSVSMLDDVGGCFEALAEGLVLAQHAMKGKRTLVRILPMLAEAQSAVRLSLRRLDAAEDPDQLAVFEWTRDTAARHRIFLKRFLRVDDLAEPRQWPSLMARIEAEADAWRLSKKQKELMEQLRDRVRERGDRRDPGNWQPIKNAINDLLGAGVPPSNRELRDLLLPLVESLPVDDAPSPSLQSVLREIDRYLATRPERSMPVSHAEISDEIQQASLLLAGKSAVLIGGIRRLHAQELLRVSLGLEQLIWIGTREHQSFHDFEATIGRPEVVFVLLAVRWSSHVFGEVKQFCDRAEKPLVRLPGGYNPQQVAVQILNQCSARLGGNASG